MVDDHGVGDGPVMGARRSVAQCTHPRTPAQPRELIRRRARSRFTQSCGTRGSASRTGSRTPSASPLERYEDGIQIDVPGIVELQIEGQQEL